MLPYTVLVCRILLGAVLICAAAGKLRHRAAFAAFAVSVRRHVGVPRRLAGPAAAGVVAAELGVGGALLSGLAPAMAFLAAAVLLLPFTAVLVRSVRRRLAVPCNCFGRTGDPVAGRHVARNGVLLAAAAIGGAGARRRRAAAASPPSRPPAPPRRRARPPRGPASPPRRTRPAPRSAWRVRWSRYSWSSCSTTWRRCSAAPPATSRCEGEQPMPYVVAAVVLVGAVSVLNLILITAVVRRMRVYEQDRTAAPGRIPYDVLGGLPPGSALPRFTGAVAGGGTVTDRDVRGRAAAVAFLSSDCPGCLERAPDFAAAARTALAGGGRAVAVIIEGAEPVDALTAAVGPATVVYEPVDRSGPMTRAFGVKTFPTFFVVDAAGTVSSRELPQQAELARTGGA
ncbi:redoxin family protein [Micromonospora sp. CPCC 205371]|nr:redoxin family protein [Micromonospora sp. CPCC 205371]